jgi:hypothetical protein
MKTRTATLLSLAGVLAAGSAAALINTQVLQGSGDALASSEAVAPPSTTGATTPVVVPVTPAALETAATPTTKPRKRHGSTTAPTTTLDPLAGQQIFQVGDSGVVTVKVVGGDLLLINAVGSPGWTVVSAAPLDAQRVQVVFRSSTVEVDFLAGLAFGQVLTDVSARELPRPGSSGTTGSSGGGTATPPPATTAPPSGDDDGEVGSDDQSEETEPQEHETEDHQSDDHGTEDDEEENDD